MHYKTKQEVAEDLENAARCIEEMLDIMARGEELNDEGVVRIRTFVTKVMFNLGRRSR